MRTRIFKHLRNSRVYFALITLIALFLASTLILVGTFSGESNTRRLEYNHDCGRNECTVFSLPLFPNLKTEVQVDNRLIEFSTLDLTSRKEVADIPFPLQQNAQNVVQVFTQHEQTSETILAATTIRHDKVNDTRTTDVANVTERHLLLRERCDAEKKKVSRRPTSSKLKVLRLPSLIVTTYNPKLFFCPIAKVGSTFFTRYLMMLKNPEKIKSPFYIKVQDAKQSHIENLRALKKTRRMEDFVNLAFKFLFVRNPYWRIFSAYIDKLYSPNPYYWKAWGRYAFYGKPKPKCLVGDSFSTFVTSVIRRLHQKDFHLIPMYKVCQLCEMNWDFVGTMEDSVRDIEELSRRLKVNASFQHSPGYRLATALDIIEDATKDVFFSWREDILKCMTMYDAGRIIWRKLQIRGVIYNSLPFPFSEDEMKTMEAEEFQQACRDAAERSTNVARLKSQKHTAFQVAYQSIKKTDLEALRIVYDLDLRLLGYPLFPILINSTSKNYSIDILNWRKPWLS
ncbi:carbohydrate sulfotransferase 8 [Biomphalaria glabrata]|nr:carbohydrate sulfotransferase 8 [Biomphalaria glabrata]